MSDTTEAEQNSQSWLHNNNQLANSVAHLPKDDRLHHCNQLNQRNLKSKKTAIKIQ